MPEKKIEDFPSISDVEEHIQVQARLNRTKIPWTRWAILALLVLIFGLVTVKIVQSNPAVLSSGKGSVSGTIVNPLATPVSAQVFFVEI